MHDIKIKTNDKLRTSVFIDGKEIDGIPGDVFVWVTPKNISDAVEILRNELLAHGEIYNGFVASIKSAILETGHYDILSVPFEFAEVIAEDILDFVIGKEE